MKQISQWFSKQPEHIRSGLALLFLTALVLAGFWEVTRCEFVNFDDTDYVTQNFHVQQGVTLKSISWALQSKHAGNWHPLTWVSHMIDWSLYGAKPAGHHFTNLLLHICNTLLLFLILKGMTKEVGKSALVAALFGIHPMHVESVAWISERKDVLSGFFAMLTIWFYSRYAIIKGEGECGPETMASNRRKSWVAYSLALFCFGLGLMSKPMLVTLPFVLLLLDIWPLNRMGDLDYGRWRTTASTVKKLFLEKWLFFALSLAASATTYVVQKNAGAMATESSLVYRFTNAFSSYLAYIGKLLWPVNLKVFYALPDSLEVTRAICSLLVVVCLSILVFMRAKKNGYLFTGWFWFLGMLVPVIGFVQVGDQAMADRYSYLPSIGLFILLTWAATNWFSKSRILPILAGAALLACVLLTQRQVSVWQNSVTLFSNVFALSKETSTANVQVGGALAFCNRLPEAIPYFERATKLDPKSDLAHLDWGMTLISMGKNEEAVKHLEESVRLKPSSASAHDNLGIALTHLKRYQEAEAAYRKAVALASDNPAMLSRLAFSLMEQKNFKQAEPIFLQSLRLDPAQQDAHMYLGYIYVTEKRFDEAIEHCREAVRLKPLDAQAQNNLQTVLSKKREAQQSDPKAH